MEISANTDRFGIADFYEIPAGSYTVMVAIGNSEMYRVVVAP